MRIKDQFTLGELLNESYKKLFFDHLQNSPSFFNWDANVIPEEILCETCRAGETELSAECGICLGSGIPPIPAFEVLGPKKSLKGKK